MKIIVWSASWCGYCHALMDWLTDSGIPYEEKNGEENPKLTGYPMTEIFDGNGKLVALVEGFDRKKILQAIEKAGGKKD
jgi:thiol-disulfide isomerase/thioredoxin